MKLTLIILFVFVLCSCKKDPNTSLVENTVLVPKVTTTVNWNEQYIGTYKGIWDQNSWYEGTYNKDSVIIISPNILDSTLTTSISKIPTIHYAISVHGFWFIHGWVQFRHDSMIYRFAYGNGGGIKHIETFKGKKQ